MKRIIFTLIFITSLISLAQAAERELLDRVVAVVNDEVITQAELDNFLRPIYEQARAESSGETLIKAMQDVRQKILSQMIEDKLVYQEAVRQEIEVNDEEVDKELAEFKRKMEKSEDLDAMLEHEGMTLKDLREKLRKQAMVRQLHDREIRSKVVVSPIEIENFYKENPEKFRVKERVRVQSLTIKKSDEAREKGIPDGKAKIKMERLEQRARKENNFEDLVVRYSEDSHAKQEGVGNWIERGAMIELVDEVLFNAPLGEMTRIVETPIGYHIFRVLEKMPAQEKKLDEVKNPVANYLFEQKSDARFRDWMEELKKSAYISIR